MHSAVDALGSVTSTSKEEDWKEKEEQGRRDKEVGTGELGGGRGRGTVRTVHSGGGTGEWGGGRGRGTVRLYTIEMFLTSWSC